MRLVAARDGPHFSHARMHPSGLLDLAFSDSVRPHFYFAWGCFRNFGSRSAMHRARETRLSMLGAGRSDSTSSHHALGALLEALRAVDEIGGLIAQFPLEHLAERISR
jgi:hypothetical protein